MKNLFLVASLFATASQKETDYSKNGANWPDDFPACKASNQSPIDLKNDVPKLNFKDDKYFKHYERVVNAKVTFLQDYSTNQVKVEQKAGKKDSLDFAYFNSQFGKDRWGAQTHFQAEQFHFHTGSEHTIEGQRFDLEMHTVHYPKFGLEKNDFLAAALGIIFDTKDYDKSVTPRQVEVIDKFFESLQFTNNLDTVAPTINYGELVSVLDTSNRWIYKGSVTTPPCATFVYWNVLNKVYPIKEKHFIAYKNIQLARKLGQDIVKTGNYRVIQKVDKHNVALLTDAVPAKEDEENTIIILGILVGLFFLATVFLCYGLNEQRKNNQLSQVSNFDSTLDGGNMQMALQHANQSTDNTTMTALEMKTNYKV